MPSELNNQFQRQSGGAGAGGHMDVEKAANLLIITFEDASQAEGLYEELAALDKSGVVNLEDAVFVTKNEDGKFSVDEKVHHEKRTGTAKGAVVGTLIGWMLGGPVLGLAGGAVVGRLIGKKLDYGVDENTIKSVANDLGNGHTALFILGSAQHTPTVVKTFEKYNGKIVQTTIDPDAQDRLQKALDSENAE